MAWDDEEHWTLSYVLFHFFLNFVALLSPIVSWVCSVYNIKENELALRETKVISDVIVFFFLLRSLLLLNLRTHKC